MKLKVKKFVILIIFISCLLVTNEKNRAKEISANKIVDENFILLREETSDTELAIVIETT